MNLKERANQIKKDTSALFLAMKQKETPWYAKAMAMLTIAYALSPIDLIPDFIPILGYLDDIIILPLFISITVRMIPQPIMSKCREEAAGLWDKGKPKRWYYALPVVLIWLILIVVIMKSILR